MMSKVRTQFLGFAVALCFALLWSAVGVAQTQTDTSKDSTSTPQQSSTSKKNKK
jgi:hypothetical protein